MKSKYLATKIATALCAALSLCPVMGFAQAPGDDDIAAIQRYRGTPVMPDGAALDRARGSLQMPDGDQLTDQMNQMRDATRRALEDPSLKARRSPVPDREYKPATAAQQQSYMDGILQNKGLMKASPAHGSGESLADVVGRYQQEQGRAQRRMESDVPDIPQNAILVFVSFSMPDAVLSSLAQQAKVVGATLVLRGMKDDKLSATKEAALAVNEARASWQINPGLFESFKVQTVPTFVMTGDKEVLDRGCPLEGPKTCTLQGSYASVRGDMSIELALQTIRVHSTIPYVRGLAEQRLALLAKARKS